MQLPQPYHALHVPGLTRARERNLSRRTNISCDAPSHSSPHAMPHQPPDPEFAARVRASFARQRVMETLGARLVRVAAGEVDVELPYREDLTQQHGYLHAGIVTTVLDSAAGYAAFSLMPAGAGVVSVEFKTHLLAPATGERLIARARVVRAGRTLTVCQADGFMVKDGVERHVAMLVGTMMTLAAGDAA
jgi:uncharacterized protein (TIGR00369 family)